MYKRQDNMGAGPASYGLTDSMGRMHGDAQFAGCLLYTSNVCAAAGAIAAPILLASVTPRSTIFPAVARAMQAPFLRCV